MWLKTCFRQVMFMVGLSGDIETDSSVREEDDVFQDIVIASYMDSYHNLSYKALTAMHWLKTYCTTPQHIIHFDDNMVVNIFKLVKYLDIRLEKKLAKTSLLSAEKSINKNISVNSSRAENISNTFHGTNDKQNLSTISNKAEGTHSKPTLHFIGSMDCHDYTAARVKRDTTSKWYVSEEEYPHEFYPQYCFGGAFIMDVEVVPLLLEASLDSPTFVWVDDCYLTGVLREICEISINSISSMYIFDNNLFNKSMIEGDKMFLHDPVHDLNIIKAMWEDLLVKEQQI